MRTKEIDSIEYVNEDDYLSAPFGTVINHILVDLNTGIITQEKINVFEKEKRNAAARKVGERNLVWVAALYR